MPEITNNTNETISFRITGKAKDGLVPTESIGPGETKNIDAVESNRFKGYLASGAISVKGSRKAAEAPAPTTRTTNK